MAQSGHCELHCTCPLLGVKRTSLFALRMSAFDPKRTSIPHRKMSAYDQSEHRVFRVNGPFRGVHSLRSEIPALISGGHSAIHKKVAASDEPTVRAHEQRGNGSRLDWGTDADY